VSKRNQRSLDQGGGSGLSFAVPCYGRRSPVPQHSLLSRRLPARIGSGRTAIQGQSPRAALRRRSSCARKGRRDRGDDDGLGDNGPRACPSPEAGKTISGGRPNLWKAPRRALRHIALLGVSTVGSGRDKGPRRRGRGIIRPHSPAAGECARGLSGPARPSCHQHERRTAGRPASAAGLEGKYAFEAAGDAAGLWLGRDSPSAAAARLACSARP